MAVYDFCSSLPDNLRERKLIRKSLVLARNEKERAKIDGKRSEMDGEKTVSTARRNTRLWSTINGNVQMLLFRKFESDNGGMGILGLTAPDEFGNMDLADAKAVSIVHEEVSYLDPVLSLSFSRGSK